MANPSSREEYVMSDVGKVYAGSYNRIAGRPWIFGQFRDIVLPAVCHLLDNVVDDLLMPTERGDPVKVARAISAAVIAVFKIEKNDGEELHFPG